jgi:hypothetical protein
MTAQPPTHRQQPVLQHIMIFADLLLHTAATRSLVSAQRQHGRQGVHKAAPTHSSTFCQAGTNLHARCHTTHPPEADWGLAQHVQDAVGIVQQRPAGASLSSLRSAQRQLLCACSHPLHCGVVRHGGDPVQQVWVSTEHSAHLRG